VGSHVAPAVAPSRSMVPHPLIPATHTHTHTHTPHTHTHTLPFTHYRSHTHYAARAVPAPLRTPATPATLPLRLCHAPLRLDHCRHLPFGSAALAAGYLPRAYLYLLTRIAFLSAPAAPLPHCHAGSCLPATALRCHARTHTPTTAPLPHCTSAARPPPLLPSPPACLAAPPRLCWTYPSACTAPALPTADAATARLLPAAAHTAGYWS